MCGIAGYMANSQGLADSETIDAMCRTMVHRGPDDQGLYVNARIALGMRRLSVIDLNTGHQPISNETKSIWVVLNGEIYNYQELAVWLRARGHRFATSSDTEVIVHLYEELGEECIHKLRGMFAFAVWDEERSRLFIARDRLGVKPLYYYWSNDQFIFGSELKAVLAHPAVERTLDPHALLYYLRYSYVPDPLSIFTGISKLPPGHQLTLKDSQLRVKSYWNAALTFEGGRDFPSEEEATIKLEEHLQEAIKLRLISDVPIGAFLSGGVDSSLVVALMAQQMTRPVSTFSIGFEEHAYNELPYARKVAKHLGTDHHELIVRPQQCDLIERIVSHFDEPFGDPSAIPTYYLSKLAAEHVTVALSGDGGDELFAGYDRYKVEIARQRFDKWPLIAKRLSGRASHLLPEGFTGKKFLRNISLSSRQRYLDNISYAPPTALARLLLPEFYNRITSDHLGEQIMDQHFDDIATRPLLSQLQYVDTKAYLPADVMTKVDRMSMAHSLEAREPLLDHVLFEYVATLPEEMKFKNGVSKYLLKRVAAKLLPSEIIYRNKQGFGVPLEYWFKDGLKKFAHDALFDSSTKGRGILSTHEVRRLVGQYEAGHSELANVIWMLVVLEIWFRLYVDRASPSPCENVCLCEG